MLDLSDIKATELPEKKEKIKICGIEKEVTFKPLTGAKRLEFLALTEYDTRPLVELLLERIYLTIQYGVGMSAEDVGKLIDLDWDAALHISGSVIKFMFEYEDSLNKETEKAEKNSAPEGQTHTAS